MGIEAEHPEYEKRITEWETVDDSLDGQRAVKGKGVKYLPMPPGMNPGSAPYDAVTKSGGARSSRNLAYDFYLSFAEFPEIVEPALTGFQGVIHAREPMVKLPGTLEHLLQDATPESDTLDKLWSDMTSGIISRGRFGLLADISADGDDAVRFATYEAQNIVNWQKRTKREGGGARLVVLREMAERSKDDDAFTTVPLTRWRELRLLSDNEADADVVLDDPALVRSYWVRTWEKAENDEKARWVPQPGSNQHGWLQFLHMGKAIDFIPFLPVNALATGYDYGAIPLMPLVRRAMKIYRVSADYWRSLYQKGDPQPVVTGVPKESGDRPRTVGGGKVWCFGAPDANAFYMDIAGDGGIPSMRQAIQDELIRFDQEGGRLLSTTQRAESGEALTARRQAHQVTLRNIVVNAGAAMQSALRMAATIAGQNPDDAVFKPDLDFAEPAMQGKDLSELQQASLSGAPISAQTIHSLMRRGGMTEKDFETEMAERQEGDLSSIPRVPDGF